MPTFIALKKYKTIHTEQNNSIVPDAGLWITAMTVHAIVVTNMIVLNIIILFEITDKFSRCICCSNLMYFRNG